VHAAALAGVRRFDTAPLYGRGGSEERLGEALRSLPAAIPRGDIVVCSKAGRLVRSLDGVTPVPLGFDAPGALTVDERRCTSDYSAEGAGISLRESLERLSVPRVHVLRIHDPNDNEASVPGVDEVGQALAADGLVAGLVALRAQGVIDDVSIGMNVNQDSHQGGWVGAVGTEVQACLSSNLRRCFLLVTAAELIYTAPSNSGLPTIYQCGKGNDRRI